MSAYGDFLKSQGATAEDIAVLDTPVAQKAFSKQQADAAAAADAALARGKQDADTTWRDFYEKEVTPKYDGMASSVAQTAAELARAKEALITLNKQGLSDLAVKMGYAPADGTPAPAPANPALPAGFDPTKFMTTEQAMALADREGEAIMTIADISQEHARLFPGQTVNFRELRKEAVAKRIPVEQLWMDRYGVAKARSDAEAARAAAHDDAIRKETTDKVTADFVSKYANPETRPLLPSSSPLAPRAATGRDKMPWERNENEAAADRVVRATQKVLQSQITH